ncbi:MAG: BlaI/MecI/CopY family transcriptional regulator [Solirubrobacteraceae bacterium]
MADLSPLQGELQSQIMAALWRIEHGSVDQVRAALPPRYRGAYTTVQTVLNRLAERGMLGRERRGKMIIYSPAVTEAQYLSRAIERTLGTASANARQIALAQLIGDLGSGELAELQRLAAEVSEKRSSRG